MCCTDQCSIIPQSHTQKYQKRDRCDSCIVTANIHFKDFPVFQKYLQVLILIFSGLYRSEFLQWEDSFVPSSCHKV